MPIDPYHGQYPYWASRSLANSGNAGDGQNRGAGNNASENASPLAAPRRRKAVGPRLSRRGKYTSVFNIAGRGSMPQATVMGTTSHSTITSPSPNILPTAKRHQTTTVAGQPITNPDPPKTEGQPRIPSKQPSDGLEAPKTLCLRQNSSQQPPSDPDRDPTKTKYPAHTSSKRPYDDISGDTTKNAIPYQDAIALLEANGGVSDHEPDEDTGGDMPEDFHFKATVSWNEARKKK
jgi:hypothetical protein